MLSSIINTHSHTTFRNHTHTHIQHTKAMNSKNFPSATQSLLNSSNKPVIPSLTAHVSFNFNKNRIKASPISVRKPNITTKASATAVNDGYMPVLEKETLYDLLGISEDGTLSDIKQAYKKMALKYHPDVSPPEMAEEYTVRFIQVHEAYETLSDPEARFEYDSCMAKGLHMAFSGKRETRFDPRSGDKNRWKETWKGQISELMRRGKVCTDRVDPAQGMSWAARIRKQRSESSVNGSG